MKTTFARKNVFLPGKELEKPDEIEEDKPMKVGQLLDDGHSGVRVVTHHNRLSVQRVI